MIDLILHAADKATIKTFAETHGLREQYVETPAVIDPETGEVTTPAVMAWRDKHGLEYVWWAGSGKMLRTLGTYDAEGNELTAPTYVNGVVVILRLHSDFFEDDRLDTEEEIPEQHHRSKTARYIKNNGTADTVQGINCYVLDGVRLFRPADVQAKLTEWGVPGHEFLGGNNY